MASAFRKLSMHLTIHDASSLRILCIAQNSKSGISVSAKLGDGVVTVRFTYRHEVIRIFGAG
jgi:hypothetical protein